MFLTTVDVKHSVFYIFILVDLRATVANLNYWWEANFLPGSRYLWELLLSTWIVYGKDKVLQALGSLRSCDCRLRMIAGRILSSRVFHLPWKLRLSTAKVDGVSYIYDIRAVVFSSDSRGKHTAFLALGSAETNCCQLW